MEPADLGWRACECGGKGAGIRLLSFFFGGGGPRIQDVARLHVTRSCLFFLAPSLAGQGATSQLREARFQLYV